MLPDVKGEIGWLDLQAQIKAKIGPSVRGTIDAVRLHDGTHIVITRLLNGECSGWFVQASVIRELGIDKLAARLIRQFRETQKGESNE